MTPDEALKYLSELKTAYRMAFSQGAGEAVLADLSPFCRAKETCIVPGDRDRSCVLGGRNEVYLRIRDFLDLTPEQLLEKYTRELRPAEGATSHARTYPSDSPDTSHSANPAA